MHNLQHDGADQCFGYGSIDSVFGSSILEQIQIRIRIQGFEDQNWEKFTTDKIFLYFLNKNLQSNHELIPWPP